MIVLPSPGAAIFGRGMGDIRAPQGLVR